VARLCPDVIVADISMPNLDGIGAGRVEKTVPMAFSVDETCDVGKEAGSPVSPDYGPTENEFSGEVNWVQIDLEKDDHDHLISLEERFRVARHGSSASRRDGTTIMPRRLIVFDNQSQKIWGLELWQRRNRIS
jgi:hypothetical protein